MNNNYLDRNQFSNITQEYIPIENSYIENILRLNKGKKVCVYQNLNSTEQSFDGILEECGKDHIIISDPNNGYWYMLLMSKVEYIKFDEDINTSKQFYSITK